MAFWGVEITSKKPYTHKYDPRFGRLRVAKATLGHGSSKDKSSLRCFVGPNAPVLLCSLFPERKESVSLGLEFEEDDDVLFTVVGPRSVHLCGYYIGARRPRDGDETDSCGEDIVDTEGEEDGGSKNEYDYEDSFIVDDGYESKEEVSVEQTREERRRRRLQKRYVMEDTDSESSLRPPGNQNKKVESSSDTESTEAFVDSFFGCSFENAVAEEKSVSKSAGEGNKKKGSGDVQKSRDNKTVKESPKKKKKKNKDGNAVGESGKKENSGVILKSLGNKAEKESPKKKKKKRNEENAVGKCDKKESIVEFEKCSGNKEEESPKNKKRKNEDLGRDRILSNEALGDGSKQRKNEEIVLRGARTEDNKKLKKKKKEKSKTIDKKSNEDVEQ